MTATSSIEPELNSLLTKLAAEIQNDQKEVEFRQKRIKKNEALLHAVKGSLGITNATAKANGHATKADLLRDAVGQIEKTRFSHEDLAVEIRRINPDVHFTDKWLRTALWTAAKVKRELVKQVVAGNNRQAAEYEKLSPPCPPHRPKFAGGELIVE
jgi:hypothetical protein